MEIRENDFVLCTVRKIDGTSIFLDIDGTAVLGSMILSEIAAGRIRNLGDYVHVGKKIVCKVLKVYKDHLELSFRRVTASEREEVLDRHKKNNAYTKILENCLKNKEVIGKIKKDFEIVDFVDEGKEDKKIFEKYLDKDEIMKLLEMVKDKVEKVKIVNKTFILRSYSREGLKEIKEILDVEGEIHYRGSSVFNIMQTAMDFKVAENKLTKSLEEIERRAKEKKAEFEILKEK